MNVWSAPSALDAARGAADRCAEAEAEAVDRDQTVVIERVRPQVFELHAHRDTRRALAGIARGQRRPAAFIRGARAVLKTPLRVRGRAFAAGRHRRRSAARSPG